MRNILKFLGVTGALLIFEACYGVPQAYYMENRMPERNDTVSNDTSLKDCLYLEDSDFEPTPSITTKSIL